MTSKELLLKLTEDSAIVFIDTKIVTTIHCGKKSQDKIGRVYVYEPCNDTTDHYYKFDFFSAMYHLDDNKYSKITHQELMQDFNKYSKDPGVILCQDGLKYKEHCDYLTSIGLNDLSFIFRILFRNRQLSFTTQLGLDQMDWL